MKVLAGKVGYRHVVFAFFTASVVLCVVASVALSGEYFIVFDAASQFNPRVLSLTKQNVSESARIITVNLNVRNPSSRPILLYGYTVSLELNGQFIAQRDVYPSLTLEPGSNRTLIESFTVIGGYAQYILQAEQSGQWNWRITYPMRFYVDWLYVTAENFGELWSGIQEGF